MEYSLTESNKFTPTSRHDWREWLSKNHDSNTEIWLVYYKKSTGKPSISYDDSVEEALCFGWIDGIKKKIDEERYCHRFTPRRKNSNWSETNIRRAKEMIQNGLMSEKGKAIFQEAMNKPDRKSVTSERSKKVIMPNDLAQELMKHEACFESFTQFAESYKKICILWIESAKKPETRNRRIKEVVSKTRAGEKIGMK